MAIDDTTAVGTSTPRPRTPRRRSPVAHATTTDSVAVSRPAAGDRGPDTTAPDGTAPDATAPGSPAPPSPAPAAAGVEDRERTARDLHDHVIQRLFAAGLARQRTAVSVPDPVTRHRLGRTVEDLGSRSPTSPGTRAPGAAGCWSRPTTASCSWW